MRRLADENIPARLVALLREGGADVEWIKTDAPGLDDEAVWSRATSSSSILLTFDKDFGEVSRLKPMSASGGVILLRTAMPRPHEVDALSKIILGRNDWAGRFSVIEPGRIRSRSLSARE